MTIAHQMRPGGLITIGEIVGQTEADIEDLFDLAFYLELVNAVYSEQLPQPIIPGDLNPNIPRVVKQVETYFKDNDIAGGSFKHYRPAGVLLQPGVVTTTPSSDTLDKAEALFIRINALLSG